jgi:PKHD-type hydroxylase
MMPERGRFATFAIAKNAAPGGPPAMIFALPNLLTPDEVSRARAAIGDAAFVDGMQTAGVGVAHAKRNEEVAVGSQPQKTVDGIVRAAIERSNDFKIIAMPHTVSPIIVSRYGQGMTYGDHSDNAILGGTQRSDMSITVFLADPSEYEGGELVLNTDIRPEAYKLAPGSVVIYPTYVLHRVDPVRRGTRVAAVGWIQSQVRDPMRRQVLIDLAQSLGWFIDATPEKRAHREYVRLEKARNNLVRMWAEM